MTEKTINNFAKAFIEAQKEMVNASKDSTNPHFKSKYADLTSVRDACVPFLNKHGIAVLQPTIQNDNKQYIKTILLHESGEEMSCLTEIIHAQNTPQAHGSGITYARRYGLQSLVCIGAEDDDGNKASEEGPKPKRNSFGLNPDSDLAKGDDMKELFEEQAAKNFILIKKDLEACESLEEVEKVSKKWKKEISGFAKYDKERFELLKDCKATMIDELTPDEEDEVLKHYAGEI